MGRMREIGRVRFRQGKGEVTDERMKAEIVKSGIWAVMCRQDGLYFQPKIKGWMLVNEDYAVEGVVSVWIK